MPGTSLYGQAIGYISGMWGNVSTAAQKIGLPEMRRDAGKIPLILRRQARRTSRALDAAAYSGKVKSQALAWGMGQARRASSSVSRMNGRAMGMYGGGAAGAGAAYLAYRHHRRNRGY